MGTGRLAGRVALITGGGAGIGRAVCVRFAAEGAVVVVADIDADSARGTVDLLQRSSSDACHAQLDVKDENSWVTVVSAVTAAHGRLDVLVNNAGLPYRRPLQESGLAQWQDLMTVNAGGTFLGLKHGARVMADAGGSIVNVSSAAALVGVPAMTSYSAGKGAIRAMSRAVAMEYAAAGVRVNSVFPTSVRTAMVESDARDSGVTVEDFVRSAGALSPLGGIAEPHDVASAVLFLASDESRFITGAELVVDGGATAGVG